MTEKFSYYEVNKSHNKNKNDLKTNNIGLINNKMRNRREEEELKKITEKLKEEKEKNKILKSENERLFQDIINIKSNIKSLIPSISQSKIYPFPSFEKLIEEIKNYLNINSVKYYQRLVNRKFPLDIIIIHFKYILQKSQDIINSHFSNVDFILNKKFKSPELTKPIYSVLKNAYQVDWKNIYNKISSDEKINKLIQDIKQNIEIKLNKKINNLSNFWSPTYINQLKDYIKITIEILLKCYLNSKKICFDIIKIGRIEKFNSISNESFINDKIFRGSEVIIIFPSFYYIMETLKKKEIINKDKVVFNTLNEIKYSYNNYDTNNTGYNFKNNKMNFKNNYFSKNYKEERDTNYFKRNKINEIKTGFRNNNNSWSNNNKIKNYYFNKNQNIKKIYFQPKGDNGDEVLIDSENEGDYSIKNKIYY